jgi:hypothetical protein
MQIYSAITIADGNIRRMWFEAPGEAEAKAFAVRVGAGLEGPAIRPELKGDPLPEAYNQEASRRMLGGISKSTLYREIQDGKLQRLPGTRRILITRASIEARQQWRALTSRR